ncbi:MAG: RecX family transcriptional regulator [Candidatus Saccharimonadales bacterium]|nr:RecX family transcriptional regulator [Candidatus Saccharibacteria bacterium]
MKITAIKTQVRREGRFSIFVDGKYAFSLSAEGLLDSGFVVGQELSQVELTGAKQQSQTDKAYNLTLAYVARRMRSEGELHDYFRRKGYSGDFGRTVLPKLKQQGLVNDTEFARRWVENRRLLKATSTKKLRMELRQKRISDEIIHTVLQANETDDRQILLDLVEKKRKMSRYQDNQKLMMYLARQGFGYQDIKSVLETTD